MAIQTDKFKVQTPISGASYYNPGEWPDDECLQWVAEENCYLLTARVSGETTNNSERTRVEFRESTPDGINVFFPVTQPHTHRMKQKLLQVCSNGRVVIGQIHVRNSDLPPLKLYFDNGKIKVGFRKTFEQAIDDKFTIAAGVVMGDNLNYSIVNRGNYNVSIYLDVNGVNVPTWNGEFDSTWAGKELYSKGGIYNQLDAALSTGPDDKSMSKLYKLEIG